MTEASIRIRFAEGVEYDAAIGDSILDVALRHDVALDHACGAVCACSTCHVKIESGAEALNEASDDEDQLDNARDLSLESRLGCQAKIERAPEGGVIEVQIPSWNVNLIREGEG